MKLVNKLTNLIRGKAATTSISQDDLFTSLNTPSLKSNVGWVYMCVKLLATNSAGLRYKLLDNAGNQIEVDGLLSLLQMPNESMSGYDFFYLIIQQLNLVGNSYWLKIRDNSGQVQRLYLLNPHAIYLEADNSYTITKYTYHTPDGIKEYKPQDVLHFKLLDPDNPIKGKSPVSAFADILSVDDLASRRHQSSFKWGAIPSGVLSPDINLAPREVENISESFQQQFAGVDNAAKIVVVGKGMKFNALQPSVRDMELLQSRIFSKESIQELFGISPALLGKTASTNKATAETEKIIFIENHVKPLQELIVRTLNHQLFKTEQSDYLLELIDPVPENKELQIKMLNELTDRVMTKNEARAALNLPAIPKGDDLMVQGLSNQFLSEVQTRKEKAKEDYDVARRTGKYLGFDEESGEDIFSYMSDRPPSDQAKELLKARGNAVWQKL